jgi:probable HAF family extracellular repeat protein
MMITPRAVCLFVYERLRTGLAVSGALIACPAFAQHTYQPLGTIPGGTYSSGNAVSGNGLVVAGTAIFDHRGFPVRWAAGGIEPLIPLSSFGGVAEAISFDGSVITGNTSNQVYRWNEATGMELIAAAPGMSSCRGFGISANGDVIVGFCTYTGGGRRAFRWTEATGMTDLGPVAGYSEVRAWGVSADGQAIAGTLQNPSSGAQRAFTWTEAGGFRVIPPLPGTNQCSGFAISGDGLVVVGSCRSGQNAQAFRWAEATGMERISSFAESDVTAYGVDWAGDVVVGGSSRGAWLWTLSSGGVHLQSFLGSAVPSSHALWVAYSVSHDGRAISGTTDDGSLIDEAFIARLAFLPCTANCDNSTSTPILNVDDFTCFINQFAAAAALPHAQQLTHYANCDGSTIAPALNIDDFTCFINRFAQGCP